MRLHTDARRTDDGIGLGFVFDIDGEVTKDCRYVEGDFTSMEAEFYALVEGVWRCTQFDVSTIHCFVDCKPLVQQLERPTQEKWSEFRDSIRWLLNKFEYWGIKWVPREKNREADYLSNKVMQQV